MGPLENATPVIGILRPGKTVHESAMFERPTDLYALSRKWSSNTCREGEVAGLSGWGKVAVAGGRSGIVLYRAVGYEGRRGAMLDSDLRSVKGSMLYSRWLDILGLTTALRAATTIIKIVFVFVVFMKN